jgi:hypothetical protein
VKNAACQHLPWQCVGPVTQGLICVSNTVNQCILLLHLFRSCASNSARHRLIGAAVVQSQQQQQQQHVLFDALVGVDSCGVSGDVRQGCSKLSQTHRSTW